MRAAEAAGRTLRSAPLRCEEPIGCVFGNFPDAQESRVNMG